MGSHVWRVKNLLSLSIFYLVIFFFPSNQLYAAKQKKDLPSNIQITAEELREEVRSGILKVEEFKYLRDQAKKLGIAHVYAFGGTAASIAHYSHWHLKQEKGDPRYQPNRFDYDYTNIFRSNQDLDIVIDGDEKQAGLLQKALAEKFKHFQGNKSAWEVRLLKNDLKEKEAVLDNPNFINQHSDSNSTGMIDLMGDSDIIKDLRDWNSPEPIFLRDVLEGKLHLYFSSLHDQTDRAKKGLNPPILWAIRSLTKAVQFELEIDPKQMKLVKKIIKEFDPNDQKMDPYVATWVEKNGKKLIQNAVDVEFAWNLIDSLGLRQKLIAIKGDIGTKDSLAWWMNKEPLRSRPQGKVPKGITAKEYFAQQGWPMENGKIIAAHETNSFLAYESITRAHTGSPNVLSSRSGFPNEGAAKGDGFYLRVGKKGAKGTGITIRFEINPDAIMDFDLTAHGDVLVAKHKEAFRVIPESLNFSPAQFFSFLAKDTEITKFDLGLLEKIKRRVFQKALLFSPEQMMEIVKTIKEVASQGEVPEIVMEEWLSIPDSIRSKYDQGLIEDLLRKERLSFWFALYSGNNKKISENPIVVDLRGILEREEKSIRTAKSAMDLISQRLAELVNIKNGAMAKVLVPFYSGMGKRVGAGPSIYQNIKMKIESEEQWPRYGFSIFPDAIKQMKDFSSINEGQLDMCLTWIESSINNDSAGPFLRKLRDFSLPPLSKEMQMRMLKAFSTAEYSGEFISNWARWKNVFTDDEAKVFHLSQIFKIATLSPGAPLLYWKEKENLHKILSELSEADRNLIDRGALNSLREIHGVKKSKELWEVEIEIMDVEVDYIDFLAMDFFDEILPTAHKEAKKIRTSSNFRSTKTTCKESFASLVHKN